MTDNQLIKKIKNGCSDSFNELISRHSNIFYKTCNKYVSALFRLGIQKEDLYDNKNVIFYDCVNSFNKRKNIKFSTWLCNNTRFYCLNLINSRKRIIHFENDGFQKIIENKPCEEKTKTEEDFTYAMFILDSLKDKRIKKIFQLRYLDSERKNKWSKVASKLNVSVQTAINLHSKGIELLNKKFSSFEHPDTL